MAKRPPKDDPDQGLLDFVPERLDRTGPTQLDSRPVGGHGRLLLSIALGLAAVVATVVTVWYIFANKPTAATKGGVPVVAADPTPIKSKPVDPGGMEVPNQDKLVYDRLGHAEAPHQAERLLPPPEAPKVPPAKAAKPPSLATPKPNVENITPPAPVPPKPGANEPPAATPAPPPAAVIAEEAAPPPAAAKPAPVATPAPPPAAPALKAEAPKPAQPPAAVAKAEPPKPAAQPPQQQAMAAPPKIAPGKDAGWRIQIAAMRDQDTAEKEWGRIAAANRDLLGGLAPDILRADLGAKGIFYRVRGGPLDEAQARKLCDELGKRKIGCMVVRK